MLKLIGCILIFISCSALGFLKASGYKVRRVELQNSLELIRLLSLEISYKKDPLQKTFERVSALKPCWFADLLQSCSQKLAQQKPLHKAWSEAIEDNLISCPLVAKDLDVLKDVSMGLGRSDVQGQRKLFEPAIVRMERSLRDAEEEERKQGRMYRGLGVAAGIVIAIVLI